MAKLSGATLDWALEHLKLESDTDLLPRPFEIDVIVSNWAKIKKDLKNVDVNAHVWGATRNTLVQKDECSFRSASQLDPIDSILFAGIIKEVGPTIHAHRVGVSSGSVYSYIFKPDPTGKFYDDTNGWEAFWKSSEEQAKASTHVVVTDVSDFYNQIYHHVVENELNACGVGADFVAALKHMLANVTQNISRGIPIGPHASHILAEMSLNPLDQYLGLKGFRFNRYVDDIHVFCNSRDEAQIALLEIATQLDTHQKLSLQRQKTEVLTSEEFTSRAAHMLIDRPINDTERVILKAIRSRVTGPYVRISLSDLAPDDMAFFTKANIESILKSYVSVPEPNYFRLRWFLRRLSQVGSPEGVEFILDNFEKFTPAIGDVANYFLSTRGSYSGDWKLIGEKLLGVLKLPLVARSDYLQVVVLSLFNRLPDLNHINGLIAQYGSLGSPARREVVIAAANAGASAWIRGFKSEYPNFDPWLKRAVLYSFKALPSEERRHWLNSLQKKSSSFERQIIADALI